LIMMINPNIKIQNTKQIPNPNVPMFKTTGVSRFEIGILIIGACLGFRIWCSGFAQGSELRFRFQPGDKYFLVSVTDQKTIRYADENEPFDSAQGGERAKRVEPQVVEQTIRLGCDLDIEDVEENGCAWARYTYRQAAMKIKAPGVNIAFDSDANQPKAKVPGPALPLALGLGESFYVKITPQGHIDKINGLQAIVSCARGKIPNTQGKEQLIVTIGNQFDESAVKRELEDQLAVFPDACATAVVVGDTWSRSEQVSGANVVVEQTWRLKSQLNGVATIDVNLIARPVANAQEIMVGNAKGKREVSGQGTGQIEIDESTGRIITNTLTKDLVEESKVSAQGLMLRPGPSPKPVRTHIVTTFQMIRRESPPIPSPAEGPATNETIPEPNRRVEGPRP
jgi:hypothetical protein